MNETEVIAVKSKAYIASLVIVVIFSIGFAIFFSLYIADAFKEMSMPFWFDILMAVPMVVLAALAVAYLVFLIRYLRLPDPLIVREGGNLAFVGNVFAIADVRNIRYRHYNYRRFRLSHPSRDLGTLCITLKSGVEYKCPGFFAVEEVHDRIFALVCEYAPKRDGNL